MTEKKSSGNNKNKIFKSKAVNDDKNYIYSIRNPIGFYQRLVTEKKFIKILNKNNITLGAMNKILDLGCGAGHWLRLIADIRMSCRGLAGIDISDKKITQAKAINNSIKFMHGDMSSLNFKNNMFDLVTQFVAFMFLTDDKDLEKAFSEVSRVLKKNGYFIFFDAVGKKIKGRETRGFSEKEIIELAENNGLIFIDKAYVFRKILFLERLNTAYLAYKIPIEALLFFERFFFFSPNNIYLLFKKQ
jgi:ubiquinone/menaquinone biosynthesis C-methylase UbiE